MKHTTHYHLNQPEVTDVVRVVHFNENADILDEQLHRLATGKADAATVQGSFDAHTESRNNPHGVTAAQAGALPAANRGIPGGVASLDTAGLVPVSQLPLPRQNLLHNWYFPAPVNQRGQSSYTNNIYSIDRWKMVGGAANSIFLDANGLLYSTTGASQYGALWNQNVENANALSGTTVTASFLFAEATGGTFSARLAHSGQHFYGNNVSGAGLSSLTLQLPSISNLDFLLNSDQATSGKPLSCRPIAAKLELGDTQTLARKDANGNWVLLDPPPDYGAELAKCQRFFYRLKNMPSSGFGVLGTGYIGPAANQAKILMPLPVSMREILRPTISYSGNLSVVNYNGTFYAVSAITVDRMTANGVWLYVTLASSATAGHVAVLWLNNDTGAYLDLDANL